MKPNKPQLSLTLRVLSFFTIVIAVTSFHSFNQVLCLTSPRCIFPYSNTTEFWGAPLSHSKCLACFVQQGLRLSRDYCSRFSEGLTYTHNTPRHHKTTIVLSVRISLTLQPTNPTPPENSLSSTSTLLHIPIISGLQGWISQSAAAAAAKHDGDGVIIF